MSITFLYLFLILKNTALLKKESVTVKYNPFFIPFLECFYKEGTLLSYKIIYLGPHDGGGSSKRKPAGVGR